MPYRLESERCTELIRISAGGQIYKKYFGISDIYPDQFGRLLQRYGFLSGYSGRNDEEQIELDDIKRKLADAGIDPGWDIVPRSNVESSKPVVRKKQKQ